MRTRPPVPTANTVLASGDSATSVSGNPAVMASPFGDGAAISEVSRPNDSRLLSLPPTSTLIGPLAASAGTSTTMDVGVTRVPRTYPANPPLVLKYTLLSTLAS